MYRNTILGSEGVLVREAIRSPNYVPGVSGWSINKDGSASFVNASIVGDLESTNYVAGVAGWHLDSAGTAEFNDIKVRGDIVADEIFSTGYLSGEGEIVGWFLGDDGSAAFSNVTIGSAGYQIDSSGNASFAAGNFANTLTLAGVNVGTELSLKGEIVKVIRITGTDTDPTGAGDVPFLQFIIPDIIPNTLYEISVHSLYFKLNGAVPAWINCSCWYRYNAYPTPPTTGGVFAFLQLDGLDGNLDSTVSFSGVIYTSGAAAGDDLYLHFRFNSNVANVTIEPAPLAGIAFNTYVTVHHHGPALVQDVAITGTGPGGGGGTPPPTPPTQKVAIFQATSTSCYAGGGGRISTTEGRQGNFSPNGNMKTAFGLPGTIAGVLAGSTINRVEVGLCYFHWYSFAGGVAVIGYHNSTDAQVIAASNQSSISGQVANQGNFPWARNEVKYVDLPIAMGNAFRDGSAKGLLIGQGLDNGTAYYGKCFGHGTGFPPTLRITYTS